MANEEDAINIPLEIGDRASAQLRRIFGDLQNIEKVIEKLNQAFGGDNFAKGALRNLQQMNKQLGVIEQASARVNRLLYDPHKAAQQSAPAFLSRVTDDPVRRAKAQYQTELKLFNDLTNARSQATREEKLAQAQRVEASQKAYDAAKRAAAEENRRARAEATRLENAQKQIRQHQQDISALGAKYQNNTERLREQVRLLEKINNIRIRNPDFFTPQQIQRGLTEFNTKKAELERRLQADAANAAALRQSEAHIKRILTLNTELNQQLNRQKADHDGSLRSLKDQANTLKRIIDTQNKLRGSQFQAGDIAALRGQYQQLVKEIERAAAAEAKRQRIDSLKGQLGQSKEERQLFGEAARQRKFDVLFGDGGGALLGLNAALIAQYRLLTSVMQAWRFLSTFVVELDREFHQLQAITATTTAQMHDLERAVISASEATRFTAIEVAEAATVLGQAGFSSSEIQAAIKDVTLLAAAVGSDLKSAVDIATSAISVFNLTAGDMSTVANVITQAINGSKLSMDKLTLGVQYAANIAAQSNVSFSEMVAVMGAMANAGIRSGSTLGTGFRQLLIDLQTPTEKLQEKLRELGVRMEDINLRTEGFAGVIRNLRRAGFTAADAFQVFEVRAAAAFSAISSQVETISQLQRSFVGTNAAAEANAIQMQSLANIWDQFKSIIGSTFTSLSGNTVEAIKTLGNAVNNLLQYLNKGPKVLGFFGDLFTAVFTTAAVVLLTRMVSGLAGLAVQLKQASQAAAVFGQSWASLNALMSGTATAVTQINGRFVAMNRTLAIAGTTMRMLSAGFSLLLGPVGTIVVVLTTLALQFGLFETSMAKAAKALDEQRAKTDRAKQSYDSTNEALKVLTNEIHRVEERALELDKNQGDLNATIAEAADKFTKYGFSINNVGRNAASLVEELRRVRAEAERIANLQLGQTIAELTAQRGASLNLAASLEENVLPFKDNISRLSARVANDEATQVELASLIDLARKMQERRIDGILEKVTADKESPFYDKGTVRQDFLDLMEFLSLGNKLTDGTQAAAEMAEKAVRLSGELSRISSQISLDSREDTFIEEFGQFLAANIDVERVTNEIRARIYEQQQRSAANNVTSTSQFQQLDQASTKLLEAVRTIQDNPNLSHEQTAQAILDEFTKQTSIATMENLDQFIKNVSSQGLGPEDHFLLNDAFARLATLKNLQSEARKEVYKGLKEEAKADAELLKARAEALSDIARNPNRRTDTALAADRRRLAAEQFRAERQAAYLDKGVKTDFSVADQLLASNQSPSSIAAALKITETDVKVLQTERLRLETQFNSTIKSINQDLRDAQAEFAKGLSKATLKSLEQKLERVGTEDEARAVVRAAIGKISDNFNIQSGLVQDPVKLQQLKEERDQAIEEWNRKLVDTLFSLEELERFRDASWQLQQRIHQFEQMVAAQDRQITRPTRETSARLQALESGRSLSPQFTSLFDLEILKTQQQLRRQQIDELGARLGVLPGRISELEGQSGAAAAIMQAKLAAIEQKKAELETTSLLEDRKKLQGEINKLEQEAKAAQQTMVDKLREARDLEAERVALMEQQKLITDTQDVSMIGAVGYAIKAELQEIEASSQTMAQSVGDMAKAGFGTARTEAGKFFSEWVTGSKSAGDAFRGFAMSVLQSMANIAANNLAKQLFGFALGQLGGFFGGSPSNTGPTGNTLATELFQGVRPMAAGGLVRAAAGRGIVGRDSVLALLEPGEFVMRKSAVSMMGAERLAAINAAGNSKIAGAIPTIGTLGQGLGGGAVNVWVVTPDQVPPPSERDIIATINKDIRNGGPTKQLIKQVIMNGHA